MDERKICIRWKWLLNILLQPAYKRKTIWRNFVVQGFNFGTKGGEILWDPKK